jgi:mono/diheme cytochrome c family protein
MRSTHVLVVVAGSLLAAFGQGGASSAQAEAADASPAGQSAAQGNRLPPQAARNFDPAQVARGKMLFEKHCASCHGPEGKGQPGDWRVQGADGRYPPPPLDDSAHAWHHPTKVLHGAIRNGIPDTHMPAWGNKLSDAQIDDLVVYIKSLWSDPVYAVWRGIEQRSLEP